MSNFASVNVDRHLPANDRVVLDLFSSLAGEQLDSVILLEPVGLQQILEVTGPELPLDAEVAASLGADGAVATDRFAELVTVDVCERLSSDRSQERRLALRSLGDAAFAQLFAGGWSSEAMVRAVAETGGSRHLQVFSEHAREQQASPGSGSRGLADFTASFELEFEGRRVPLEARPMGSSTSCCGGGRPRSHPPVAGRHRAPVEWCVSALAVFGGGDGPESGASPEFPRVDPGFQEERLGYIRAALNSDASVQASHRSMRIRRTYQRRS